MKDVDVGHSLCLQVSIKLSTPFGQKSVSGTQFLVGLFLTLKFTGQDGLLQFMCSLGVGEVGLGLAEVSLEFENVLLVVADLLIEGILLVGVGGLQLADLFSVDFS